MNRFIINHRIRKRAAALLVCAFTAGQAATVAASAVREVSVVIDPACTRRIEGTSDLNRSTYFNLFTHIDKPDCKTPEIYDWLVKENRIVWGSIQGVMTA